MTVPPGRAAIVGGGLGGLATALRLASAGWQVTLCEAGPTLGGKMNRRVAGGYVFDTGPSLITMPWIFESLFAAAGTRLAEHLELVPVDPLAHYVFADGTTLDSSGSLPAWLAEIRRLEPADVDGFWQFMRLGAQIFELSRATFFRRGPLEPPDRESLAALRHLPLRRGWGNYHRTVASLFRSPYLRQLYDRYPTYVGSSPYASPATLAVIPYIEMAFGGWYVRGGLYRIVEAIATLARQAGVELRTSAPVTRIATTGGRVAGLVLADGERVEADVVVMNGDASRAPGLLAGGTSTLPAVARSLSGLVFLIGTRSTRPELHHHAVYFSGDYQREFTQLFDERRFPDDPTVYVNVPSRTDRSVVPGDGETLFVMANAPASTDPAWDTAAIETARARVLARLERGGLRLPDSDTVVTDVWTPERLASTYDMPGGAIYGTHSHGWRHAFLRPPNRDRRVRGLYYVGGSTHPGGGTPTVLLSAEITTGLIARDGHR